MIPYPVACISQPLFSFQYFILGDVAIREGVMWYFMTTIISKPFGFSLDLGMSLTILRVNIMSFFKMYFKWLIVVTLSPALLVLYRRNGLSTAI